MKDHLLDIVARCNKRLRLLKALTGQDWGTTPEIIPYTYKTFVRLIMEYAAVITAYADPKILHKFSILEQRAIKIAYRLPSWTLPTVVYSYTHMEPILDRLKRLASIFLVKNGEDPIIKDLISTIPKKGNSIIKTILTDSPNPLPDTSSPAGGCPSVIISSSPPPS